jgi:hypothetical protein
MPLLEMRRLLCVASLTITACGSPPVVQPAGPNQYIVTVSCPLWHCPRKNTSLTQVSVAAAETCTKLGKQFTLTLRYTPKLTTVNPRYQQLRFECLSPYEIVPIDSDTLAVYGNAVRGSFRMWVPTSEIPAGPGGFDQVMQPASDYCAKMNLTMKLTGGGFDLGTGLDVIFSCVPKQQG